MTGESAPRSDAWEKVTGRACYAIDASIAHMAHAAVVRSERAHARIAGIDRADAEAAPGVIAVVTADDLGELGRRFGHIVPDHAILAVGKVRYYGEPVAVVVAETPHQAADAAELVWVDYDDLPALTDAASALASDVLIHEQSYVEPGQEFLGVAPGRLCRQRRPPPRAGVGRRRHRPGRSRHCGRDPPPSSPSFTATPWRPTTPWPTGSPAPCTWCPPPSTR